MSKLKVNVNGKAYEVEIENAAISPTTVIVNGKSYQVDIENLAAETLPAKTVESAPVVKSAAAAPAPPRQAVVVSSGNDVRAPMPGVIIEVNVKPGQSVSAGEQVCALEAMKMKNAIRAMRDGIIATVEVRDGQKVAYNDVLVTFQ